MNTIKIAAILVCTLLALSSAALAGRRTPEERGKALFNDPKLGNGRSGKSCNTCHPDGKGLEGIAAKKEWKTPGGATRTIEEAVNICITMALQGKALKKNSPQMKDLVSYLKALKTPSADAPKAKAPVGC